MTNFVRKVGQHFGQPVKLGQQKPRWNMNYVEVKTLTAQRQQNNNFSAVRRNEIRILISATKMKLNIQGLLVPFPYDYIYPGITVLNTFLSKPRR